jgi:hypothetical protein
MGPIFSSLQMKRGSFSTVRNGMSEYREDRCGVCLTGVTQPFRRTGTLSRTRLRTAEYGFPAAMGQANTSWPLDNASPLPLRPRKLLDPSLVGLRGRRTEASSGLEMAAGSGRYRRAAPIFTR